MHAQKDMKTEVLNDQNIIVHNNRVKTVVANETNNIIGAEKSRVKVFQDVAVKGKARFISGDQRIEQAVGIYIIGAGDCIRLECGLSALELFANGTINLAGENFNFSVKKNGEISTGGVLALNPTTPGKPAGTPGPEYKNNLINTIEQLFPEKDK